MIRSHKSNIIRRSLLWGLILPLCLQVFSSNLQAQFYFGRNKIQYEDFSWQILKTDHFHIYYYPEEKPLAIETARIAETAFDEYEIKFNHTLSDTIPLVLYSNHIHFQQTNTIPNRIPEGIGGFFEFIKGRVVLPFTGDMAQFHHVIRHELVHVFMHSKINEGIRNQGLWEAPSVPLWFTEGLAEWWSDGWDSQAEMFIRDALLYDRLIPLNRVGGYLVYKEGQSFLRYYAKKYGKDRIRRLMDRYWLYDNFEEAVSVISGISFEEIMTAWELDLKKSVSRALQTEDVPQEDDHQLTRRGISVGPAVYRDHQGKLHVVYLSNRDGYTSIFQRKIDPVKQSKKPSLVLWGERTAELESLHLLQTNIDVNQRGELVFVSKSGKQDVLNIVPMDDELQVDPGDLSQWTHPNLVSIRSPSWSPDGESVVFSAQDKTGRPDLYLLHRGEQKALRLMEDYYTDIDPVFSVDGRWIVFSSDRGREIVDGGMDLFAVNLVDYSIFRLTDDGFKNTHPSPIQNNANSLLFISDRSGTPNAWRLTMIQDSTKTGLFSSETLQLSPVTKLHTGVQTVQSMTSDSLLLTTFQSFSFRLRHQSFQPGKLDSVIKFRRPEFNPHPWEVTDDDEEGKAHPNVPYKMKYSLDLAQTAVAYDPIYGFLGGAQLSISDLLGNRYYHFLLANTAQVSSEFLDRFNLAVTVVDLSQRLNWAVSAFRFANDYFDPYQAFYFEKTTGIRAGISYPFSVFNRMELSTSLWHSTKDYYFGDVRKAILVSNFISVVHDNTLWTPVGPIDGWRARITIGPTFDFQRSQVHNYTGLLDFRYYYRFNRFLTLAHRSMFWMNDGRDVRRFYVGGPWGLRGYGWNSVYGRKVVLINHELRFPFANSLAVNFRDASIGLAPIRGAIFLDAGNGWEDQFPGWIGSFGIGLRGNFLGALVLRWDLGRTTDFKHISEQWFSRLFFGWDY